MAGRLPMLPKILVTTLLLCCACSSAKVYYGYGEKDAESKAQPVKKGYTVRLSILPEVIRDPAVPTALTAQISFNGEYRNYPKGLEFELYEGEQRVPLALPKIHVATVVDGRVTYFRLNEPLVDVPAMIVRLKKEKGLPERTAYFQVSGHVVGTLARRDCPPEYGLSLITRDENGVSRRELIFSLGKREYGRAHSRPFG